MLHRYVYFDLHHEMHVVNAEATTDPERPATTTRTSKRPRPAPRNAPPILEPELESEEEHPSDALAARASILSPRSGADTIADSWTRECPSLAQPANPLAVGVRKKLDAAARRESDRDWNATFRRVNDSAFLMGGKTGFRASLLWITNADNLAKLDAGQYDDGRPQTARSTDRLVSVCAEALAGMYPSEGGA